MKIHKKELFKVARAEYDTAMNMAGFVIAGDLTMTVDELLESFAILKFWVAEFDKRNATEDEQMKNAYQGLKELFLGLISHYDEIFFNFEGEILCYFKLKQQEGFTPEELEAAKFFVQAAKENPGLAVKDWDRFLPKG